MSLSPEEWHKRFSQQAQWTRSLRDYLFQRAGMHSARRVLDVGCGTGALLGEMDQRTNAEVHGLDINPQYLSLASANTSLARLALGDAYHLPYPTAIFDVTFCHFLLLWLANPLLVVREMARLTRPGGCVIALAEPDYGGRIDYPSELAQLGAQQKESLRRQGAEPEIGRRLSGMFHQAGLVEVETGVLGGQWKEAASLEENEQEWQMLRSDLGGWIPVEELEKLYAIERVAYIKGERVLFVPTFYAMGKV